jgi:cell division septation protein DedD
MADDESRGVHLSDEQLVFVFMAATVVAVVVFLFGVLVGRGVQQARGPLSDDGMTAASEVVPDGAAGEAPVADAAPRWAGGGSGGEDFSYPERLGKTPPAEQLKPVLPPVEERSREAVPPDVPAEPMGPGAGASAPRPAAAPAAAASAPYTVQVAAVMRRDEAEAIVKRLKTKGYDAYVFVPDAGDAVGGFRVRIGSFKDKRQANALAERLLLQEKRYKPWVTR